MHHRIRTRLPRGAAALVRRARRPEARPLVDLSDFQPAKLSDFGPALTTEWILESWTTRVRVSQGSVPADRSERELPTKPSSGAKRPGVRRSIPTCGVIAMRARVQLGPDRVDLTKNCLTPFTGTSPLIRIVTHTPLVVHRDAPGAAPAGRTRTNAGRERARCRRRALSVQEKTMV